MTMLVDGNGFDSSGCSEDSDGGSDGDGESDSDDGSDDVGGSDGMMEVMVMRAQVLYRLE